MAAEADHSKPVLLSRALPEFASELRDALRRQGEEHLSSQVASLRVFSLCDCGDDFCQTFYTDDRSQGIWADGNSYSVVAQEMGKEGWVIVGVRDEEIREVEVLHFPEDLLSALNRALNPNPGNRTDRGPKEDPD